MNNSYIVTLHKDFSRTEYRIFIYSEIGLKKFISKLPDSFTIDNIRSESNLLSIDDFFEEIE